MVLVYADGSCCQQSFYSVLVLFVSAKVHFALKAFPAQITGERFESCVLAAVCDEVGALTECFSADLALVWLFS